MERIQNCPICDNAKFEKYISSEDYFLSREKFELEKCDKCALVFTNPRPSKTELGKYYKSEEYISHSGTKKGLTNKLYHIVRNFTIHKKFQTVSRFTEGKNITDYGSGSGLLLSYFKKNNWNISGFEQDENARKISAEINGVNSMQAEKLNEVEEKSQDAIMMWHVLEHIPDPNSLLGKFHEVLKENGTIFIAVPNIDSYDAKFYKNCWAALDVPRHLFHYNHKTIKLLLEKNNFKLMKIKPLIFDSFYISIISEKYSGKKSGFIYGIFLGLISNIFAVFKSKNYSSCLYIAKKS